MSAYPFSRVSKPVPAVYSLHRGISTEIPAPGTDEILYRLDAVESRSMHGQLPIVWSGAFGHNVWDIAGNRFIDFTSGIFVANVGHSNAAVERAMRQSLICHSVHSYAYATDIRARYLEKLTRWSGFEKAFLLSAGTEATEAALKLMRLYGAKTGRRGIVCVDGAFHGRTVGAQLMGAGGGWLPSDPDIHHIKPWSLIPLGTCGVMVETFQGWSARFHDSEWIQQLAGECGDRDILLCFDEMQSGFARTGRKFGYEHYGVQPDLICVGKGMGNGVPLSGVLGRADVLDLPGVGNMSSTHSGNPLCCAAGLAVIEEIERLDLVNEVERKEKLLFPALANMWLKVGVRVSGFRGHGLIAAVHFGGENPSEFASRVAERCMQKGLLVVHTGRESIKIGPPLTIPDEVLLEGVSVITEAIAEIQGEAA